MAKSFMCSLICNGGIIGGAICVEGNSITYKTNKLTVDRKYKMIELSKNQICEITWKWIVLPIATFHLLSGEKYKLIIFNKKGFEKRFNISQNK